MDKNKDGLHAIAADMDGMKENITKLSNDIITLQKIIEKERTQEHEPMVPPPLPIVANPKSSPEDFYSPIESLEDAVDDLENEVLARTATINGCITKIQEKISGIHRLLEAMCRAMIEMEDRDIEYNKRMKTTADYITENPTPKVELTQWQRVSLKAKSWFNKEFLTDFRVLILLFYLTFASSIAIGYAVMFNKTAKHNAALEYYIQKNLEIPHRK